ncbi:hypothetical protein GBAR_LOCUS12432, partial [Geodia barretti]
MKILVLVTPTSSVRLIMTPLPSSSLTRLHGSTSDITQGFISTFIHATLSPSITVVSSTTGKHIKPII